MIKAQLSPHGAPVDLVAFGADGPEEPDFVALAIVDDQSVPVLFGHAFQEAARFAGHHGVPADVDILAIAAQADLIGSADG